MKRILLIGAGRSSTSLIRYLLENAKQEDWFIRVGDMNPELARSKVKDHSRAEAFEFNALDMEVRQNEIRNSDLVISMLPASMHILAARDCIAFGKNVITPSYVNADMLALHSDAEDKGVLILNELGVDPGIDHMSAMSVIHKIQNAGHELIRFESFTGGLVAPESDDNPWRYKFTWNPRNVVLAGQGGSARFLQHGRFKYIPSFKLFERVKPIQIEGYDDFEGYANRDSLRYRQVYGLENIPTIYRGTLRRSGFSEAWNVFVQLGMTQDDFDVDNLEGMTVREFTNSFLSYDEITSVEDKLRNYLDTSDEVISKLKWLGIFENTPLEMKTGTPAQVLQHILEKKWGLKDGDKDMIVMWHRFNYLDESGEHELHASLVYIGEDQEHTAMAKTVGLPLGIAAKKILRGDIKSTGVQLPVTPGIYEPILEELKEYGIELVEKEVEVSKT